jgi:glucose/mannose-6-phosphate isomerase
MPTNLLDKPEQFSKLDPSGMLQKAMDVPWQFQDARGRVKADPPRINPKGIRTVLLAGMGGSAIGGDVLRTLFWKKAKVQFVVNRHYDLPGWVSQDTLVVGSSYSGDTEETLSVFKAALARKCKVLAVSSGGKLMGEARKRKIAHCEIPGGLPPRAAFGYSFITLMTALESLGLLPSMEKDFHESLEILLRQGEQYGPLAPTAKNPAKQLARFLFGKLPVIYAGQDHLESVGLRWKTQINENAKQAAFFNVVPEMNHNEVLGYSYPEPLTKKMAVILLRHPQGDHPQIKRRFDILRGILKLKTAGVREVQAQGKSLLAQMLSVIYLADFVSVYLAYLRNIDPTPIDLIDQFKKKLSR